MRDDVARQGQMDKASDHLVSQDSEPQALESRLRWAQESQALAVRILNLLNRQVAGSDAIRKILGMVKEFTGFEAVAIRLRDGDDFPYFETKGFPADFVEAENSLCNRNEAGEIIRDSAGNPVLECMCGNILCGRTNPSFSFFTQGGSFWSSHTTELLATTSEADRQARTRNRCNAAGYESVALIPLRSDRETIGLLQLNDSRKDCFTLDMITFFEEIGAGIGIVLARVKAEEALRHANETLEIRVRQRTTELNQTEQRFRAIFDNHHVVMLIIDPETGRVEDASPAACNFYGCSRDELRKKRIGEINILTPEQLAERLHSARSRQQRHFDFQHRLANGEIRDVEVCTGPIDVDGKTLLFSVINDITDRKRAEAALLESEERYRNLFQNAPIGLFQSTVEGTILKVNSAYAQMYGYESPEEVIDCVKNVAAQLYSQPAKRSQIIEKALEQDRLLSLENDYRRKDGTVFNGNLHLQIVRNNDGSVNHLEGFVEDITARKEAENALRKNESMLRNILSTSPVGIVGLTGDRNIEWANEASLKMFGFEAEEEIVGRNAAIVYPSDAEYNRVGRLLYECLKTGETTSVDATLKRKDGSLFDGHIRMKVLNPSDPNTGTIAAITDISERKRAEVSLRQSEQRLELALSGANLGLWDLHVPTGQIVANERIAGILGYALHEVDQTVAFWESQLHPEDRDRVLETMNAHLEGRNDYYEDEYRLRAKSGEWKWILTRGKVVARDEGGTPVRMTGTWLDITDRKQAEEKVRESEERYRTVAEFTYDWEYWVAPDDKLLYVSPSCERITGYSAQEFLDDPGLMERIVHPDDMADTINHFHVARKVHHESSYSVDFRIIHRDGQKRWINHVCRPVHGKGGQLLGRRASNRDITLRKEAEDALRQSQQKYRLIFEHAPLGILHFDRNGVMLDFNDRFVKMIGAPREKLVGFNMPERQKDERMRQAVLDVLSGKTSHYEGDYLSVTGGKLTPMRALYSPVLSDDGMLLGGVGLFEDITERKRAAESLSKSEERLRLAQNAASVGVWEWNPEDGTLDWTPELEALYGLKPGTVRSYEDWTKLVHPEDLPKIRSDLDEAIAQHCPFEFTFRVLTGSCETRWLYARGGALYNNGGQPSRVLGINIDITERVNAEVQRSLLTSAIEQSAEAVVITDAEGNIRYVNPAFEAITGYTSDDAIGQNTRLLKSGEHGTEFYKHLWHTVKRGDIWSGRFINRKKDGRLYHEDATISPVKDSSGKIVNFVAVKRDITEHLELSKQLLQAQKMEAVGTLAGGIAHDFNNILQVVLGYSDLILADEDLSGRLRKDLEKILLAGRNGADLVQRLLTFSRKAEIKPLDLDLNQRVRQTRKFLERTIPKMIEIELALAEELAPIHADPVQIDQVIMNLAVNARDVMPEGGKLVIKTANVVLDDEYAKSHLVAKPGTYVLLQISDTGSGMDRETLEHIFEPFYTTKGPGEGTGLGLAMVYGIVQQHHGLIRCYSEVGGGTTFKIYLPAVISETKLDQPVVTAMPHGGTETILLVDDEELLRDLGKRILSKAGYTILTASNGKQALEIYRKEHRRVALVILDLIMPEMGGKQCLQNILKINPRLKVLIASGYSAKGPTKEAIEEGAKGFVSKPFDIRQLLQTVRDALDGE